MDCLETKEATSGDEISPQGSVVISVNYAGNGGSSGGPGGVMASGSVALLKGGNAAAARLDVGKVAVGQGAEGRGHLELDGSRICRICHLSPELVGSTADGWGLIHIGCGCTGELGSAHRRCAEAWFRVKRNRFCEICGLNAKNIIGVEDSSFMEQWKERGSLGTNGSRNSSGRVSCWSWKSCRNILMSFLVVALLLPWFFRTSLP